MATSHNSSDSIFTEEQVTTMGEAWARLAHRKAKKRAQNREAQRSYRQRLKARNEALQARIDQLEQTQQSRQPSPSSPWDTRTGTREQRRIVASAAHASIASSSSSIPSLATSSATISSLSVDRSSRGRHQQQPQITLPRFDSLKSSSAPGTVTYGAVPSKDLLVGITPANMVGHAAFYLSNSSPQYDCFGDAPQSVQQGGLLDLGDNMGVIDPDIIAIFPTTANSKSQSSPSSSSPSSNLTTPTTEHNFRQASLESVARESTTPSSDAQPPPQFIPSSEAAVDMSMWNISNWSNSDVSLEDRLSHVAEQAKRAGFEDLDALFAAYHSSLYSGRPQDVKSSARRLPRLIAMLRLAVQEWKDWERRGFLLD